MRKHIWTYFSARSKSHIYYSDSLWICHSSESLRNAWCLMLEDGWHEWERDIFTQHQTNNGKPCLDLMVVDIFHAWLIITHTAQQIATLNWMFTASKQQQLRIDDSVCGVDEEMVRIKNAFCWLQQIEYLFSSENDTHTHTTEWKEREW